uniref:Uncharacterized protein n=2 Tax=Dunaliella tertiolecta TaxID=3047 RepID=A0A7S3QY69_DUNTE
MRTKSQPRPSRNGSEDSLEQHQEEMLKGRSRAAKRGRPDQSQEDVMGIVGMKMRVWWCPTEEESKTDYSGAWWPGAWCQGGLQAIRIYVQGLEDCSKGWTILPGIIHDTPIQEFSRNSNWGRLGMWARLSTLSPLPFTCAVRIMAKGPGTRYMVKYDNGETGSVLAEHLSPYEVPMDFGKEALPLQVTEFCEVFNGSSTDPCAWAACISRTLKNGEYTVRYPFHDTEPEKIPASRIRRLRVLEGDTWKLLRPNQHWRGGEVTSPMELETIDEEELGVYVDLSRVLQQQTHEAVGKGEKENKGDKADNKDKEGKDDKADNKDKESKGEKDKEGEGDSAEKESKADKDEEEDKDTEAPNKKSKQ